MCLFIAVIARSGVDINTSSKRSVSLVFQIFINILGVFWIKNRSI